MKRTFFWILFLLLLFISSYYREVVFRSINALIKGETFFYAKTISLPILEGWTKAELVNLKYTLTIGFSFLFISLTSLGLKISFRQKIAFQTALATYLILIAFAVLVALIGIPIQGFEKTYPLLRMMVGWVHNPLLFLLISAGILGYSSLKHEN